MTVPEMPPCFKRVDSSLAEIWLPGHPGAPLLDWVAARLVAGTPPASLSLPLQQKHGKLGLEALELSQGRVKFEEALKRGLTLPSLALIHRESWEQSSKPPQSSYHASLFKGCKRVLEVGTGLGLDTIALANVVPEVVTLEPDPLKADIARKNFAQLGLGDRISVVEQRIEDARDLLVSCDGLFADPSRRIEGGQRVRDPADCSPALDTLLQFQQLRPEIRTVVIKLSPLAISAPLPDGVRREMVGSEREVRELLWISHLNQSNEIPSDCDIVLLDPFPQVARWQRPLDGAKSLGQRLEGEHVRFLYEFDPTVHAVPGATRALGVQYGLSPISSEHGYFASTDLTDIKPWARSYEVLDRCALKAEKIQALVDLHKLGKNTAIKKREHKMSPDALHASLRWHPDSAESGEFALMCVDSKPKQWCFLVRRR